jgi:hypothetical protein
MAMPKRAEIFEEIFGANIENFSTAEEIDQFIQETRGIEKLKIEEIRTNVVCNRGNSIELEKADLNDLIDSHFSYS